MHETTPSKHDPSTRQIILYAVIIFVVCLALMTGGLVYLTGHTPLKVAKALIDTLYHPSANVCLITPLFKNINTPKLLYAFGFLCLLTIGVLAKCVRHAVIPWARISLRLTTTVLILFLLSLAGAQQVARLNHLGKEWEFLRRPDSELRTIIRFCRRARDTVPGPCQADIVSDHDLGTAPHMLLQRCFSYYLYPEISARFDNGAPTTCRVIIQSEDFDQHVPEDYTLVLIEENRFSGFALKKGWVSP
jgi:hypothetical protein